MGTRDLALFIDGVEDGDLTRLWDALSAVAHGFMLDGFEASVRVFAPEGSEVDE